MYFESLKQYGPNVMELSQFSSSPVLQTHHLRPASGTSSLAGV